jgi:hypothetical protein
MAVWFVVAFQVAEQEVKMALQVSHGATQSLAQLAPFVEQLIVGQNGATTTVPF